MTQTTNRFFDEIGRLMNDAAGAAQGVKREVDTVLRNQAEKILRDLDIVKTINHDHQSNLGVYAAVTQPGAIAMGDAVDVDGA